MIRFRSLKCVSASVDPSFFFDKIILKRSVGILDKNHKNTSIGIGITHLNINHKRFWSGLFTKILRPQRFR